MFVHLRYAGVMFLAVATCALDLQPGGVAYAAKPDWRDAFYPYTIVNQDVADIVKNFGYNTEGVRGAGREGNCAWIGEFKDGR